MGDSEKAIRAIDLIVSQLREIPETSGGETTSLIESLLALREKLRNDSARGPPLGLREAFRNMLRNDSTRGAIWEAFCKMIMEDAVKDTTIGVLGNALGEHGAIESSSRRSRIIAFIFFGVVLSTYACTVGCRLFQSRHVEQVGAVMRFLRFLFELYMQFLSTRHG